MKSKKIRESARGEDCQVRIPGTCNFNPETTILAHVGIGGGMGSKASDIEASYCCSSCHDLIDGRVNNAVHMKTQIKLMAYEGAQRTRQILVSKNLIKLK